VSAHDLGPQSCHCVTCADDGVPMRVLAVERSSGLARCVEEHGAGPATEVETALIGAVAPGERLLVHAGVALVRLEAVR
jgi:hydrogenase maturation factor